MDDNGKWTVKFHQRTSGILIPYRNLDGMIQGNVHAGKLVIINKGGKVDGDVDCDELYINGTITGNVCVACKTVMGGDAVIEGGLITDTLEITLGATIRKGLKLKKRRNKLR